MFESLMLEKRKERGIAQPVLSFAIHAGLIALAVGQVPDRTLSEGPLEVPLAVPFVTVDQDGAGTKREVETRTESPWPQPTCNCNPSIPGPISLDEDDFEVPGGPAPWRIPSIGHPTPDSVRPVDPGVYREGDLSDSPVLVHRPDPAYPPALKAAGVEGAVQVTYVIDVGGRVEPTSITIVSSDHPFRTDSVRAALLQARFQPGRVRGAPVRSLVRQTIRFSLMSL